MASPPALSGPLNTRILQLGLESAPVKTGTQVTPQLLFGHCKRLHIAATCSQPFACAFHVHPFGLSGGAGVDRHLHDECIRARHSGLPLAAAGRLGAGEGHLPGVSHAWRLGVRAAGLLWGGLIFGDHFPRHAHPDGDFARLGGTATGPQIHVDALLGHHVLHLFALLRRHFGHLILHGGQGIVHFSRA